MSALAIADLWTEAERRAWELPDDLTVSQWADRHRVLDAKISSEPGPWRTARTPYLREPMDCGGDPTCEELTIKKSTQVGGTEAVYNIIAYRADRLPGPTLIVMPRERDAKKISGQRVQPMFELSPKLRESMTGRRNDMNDLELTLRTMTVNLASADSPAALSNSPIKDLHMDETDKYPAFSGKEADPVRLARERTRTYIDTRFISKVSTPTTTEGYINREYDRSDKRRYHCPCARCGHWQVLLFPQVKWPKGKTTEEIKIGRLAYYECAKCKAALNDAERWQMIERGVWVPEAMTINEVLDCRRKGKSDDRLTASHRGYALNCLMSPWLTMGEIAAEFLDSKRAGDAALMNFINSWLGEVWENKSAQTTIEEVRGRVLGHPAGTAPKGAKVLLATVDVQKDHFWVRVRAWGMDMRSWGVAWRRVETWDQVAVLLYKTSYKIEGMGEQPIRFAFVDSGHRASEVYEFCRLRPDVTRAIKGQGKEQAAKAGGQRFWAGKIDRNPTTGAVIPGGLQLIHVDTFFHKDQLHRFIHANEGDVGEWWLEAGLPEEYFAQMTSESKVTERNKAGGTREIWKVTQEGAANHGWDDEVYQVALANYMQLDLMRDPEKIAPYRPPAPEPQRPVEKPGRGGWIGGRGPGFIKKGKGWV